MTPPLLALAGLGGDGRRGTVTFAVLARDTRKRNRRYLREVADAIGISVAYVSEIERGNRPVPTYLARDWASAVLGDPDEFEQAAWEGRRVLTIHFDDLNPQQRQAAFFFAKSVNGLSDKACEVVMSAVRREIVP